MWCNIKGLVREGKINEAPKTEDLGAKMIICGRIDVPTVLATQETVITAASECRRPNWHGVSAAMANGRPACFVRIRHGDEARITARHSGQPRSLRMLEIRGPGVVVVASAGRRASTASRRVEHRKQFFDYLSLLLLL